MEIAVIGGKDFCLGFRLAGIKNIFETDNPKPAIFKVEADPEVGIVILDKNILGNLDVDDKELLENSHKPIYITISTKLSDDELKKMIRKSIGVEL